MTSNKTRFAMNDFERKILPFVVGAIVTVGVGFGLVYRLTPLLTQRVKDTSSTGYFRGFGAKADSTSDERYVSLQTADHSAAIKGEDLNQNGIFETFTGYLDTNNDGIFERYGQNEFPKDNPLAPYFNEDSLNLAYKTIRGQK